MLQELTGPACALYVSVENLGWSKRGRAHDLRASHDGGGGEGGEGDGGELHFDFGVFLKSVWLKRESLWIWIFNFLIERQKRK